MAYRRRQGMSRSSTFKEEAANHNDKEEKGADVKRSYSFSSSTLSPLATQAIHTSIAQSRDRDAPPLPDLTATPRFINLSHECHTIEEGSEHSDSKSGFWGILARKAKAILEEENASQQFDNAPTTAPVRTINTSRVDSPRKSQSHHRHISHGTPRSQRGLDAISTPTLNQIGESFDKVLEDVRTPRVNKTPDILHETRKIRIRRKGLGMDGQSLTPCANMSRQPGMLFSTQNQSNHENQLKASRDVAMATAAKAKILLRELKTVKADLAFAKERCAQLEEENRFLRARKEGEDLNPADDDLIRLQLETLLAEKARLANENSIYARENRYLREIVEYHQLTMQDIVYLDEGSEEDSEVEMYPLSPFTPSDESFSNPNSPQEESSIPNPPLSNPNSPQEVTSSIPNSPLSIPNLHVLTADPDKVEENKPSVQEHKDESATEPNKVEGNKP